MSKELQKSEYAIDAKTFQEGIQFLNFLLGLNMSLEDIRDCIDYNLDRFRKGEYDGCFTIGIYERRTTKEG